MTTTIAPYYSEAHALAFPGDFSDWETVAADWVKNLKSPRTREVYLDAWRGFLSFVGKPPAAVTHSDVTDFRVHLKTAVSPATGRPYSQSTINQRLSAISSFYREAVKRGLRLDNPADGVARESVTPYGKATFLSPEEGEDLAFVAAIDKTTDQGRRDFALFLLYLTGAFRVSEVASMRVGDLRRQGRRLFVTYTRKGGLVEAVQLADEAADALDDYLATRGELKPDAPLFVAGEKGRKAAAAIGRYDLDVETPLTTRAIRYLVASTAKRAFGSSRGLRPHSLRHTAAQAALLEGGSVTEVSRLLKHKNIGITTVYLHATSKSDAKTAAALGRRYGSRPTLASD